jgi:hypothetical protein
MGDSFGAVEVTNSTAFRFSWLPLAASAISLGWIPGIAVESEFEKIVHRSIRSLRSGNFSPLCMYHYSFCGAEIVNRILMYLH